MGELYIDGRPLSGLEAREYCDSCQKYQPLQGGYTVKYDELAIMWICQACRSTS